MQWLSHLLNTFKTMALNPTLDSKMFVKFPAKGRTSTCATHPRSFPLHKTRRWFPEVQRCTGGRELWILKQLLVLDAVALQLAVVLVLVRDGGGEHGPDSEASQLRINDRNQTFFFLLHKVFRRALCGQDRPLTSDSEKFWEKSHRRATCKSLL